MSKVVFVSERAAEILRGRGITIDSVQDCAPAGRERLRSQPTLEDLEKLSRGEPPDGRDWDEQQCRGLREANARNRKHYGQRAPREHSTSRVTSLAQLNERNRQRFHQGGN
jgi:hypothetical protein